MNKEVITVDEKKTIAEVSNIMANNDVNRIPVIKNGKIIGKEEIEITPEYKNTDMALVPHPFNGNDLTGKSIVLLNYDGSLCHELADYHQNLFDCPEANVSEMLYKYIDIDNKALDIESPPGVMVVNAKWKLTR